MKDIENKRGVCRCDDEYTWKDTLLDAAVMAAFAILGMAVGIGLCKFWPEFWRFVNGRISV